MNHRFVNRTLDRFAAEQDKALEPLIAQESKKKSPGETSPDAVFNRLYEAAPELTWHVSFEGLEFARCAAGFTPIDEFTYWSGIAEPGARGRICGCWVLLDAGLKGKTIELRDAGKVLSTITLE